MAENIKTDREIQVMAITDWVEILSRLWVAVGKPEERDRATIYGHALGDIPFGLLERGVNRILRSHRFSSVPTIGEIIEAVKQELGNSYDFKQAIAEWIAAQPNGVYRGGVPNLGYDWEDRRTTGGEILQAQTSAAKWNNAT
jgi:hypothetical protein